MFQSGGLPYLRRRPYLVPGFAFVLWGISNVLRRSGLRSIALQISWSLSPALLAVVSLFSLIAKFREVGDFRLPQSQQNSLSR